MRKLFIALMLLPVVALGQNFLAVDAGCDNTNTTFSVGFVLDAGSGSAFTAYYLAFKLCSNASGSCTVTRYYSGSSIDRTGGITLRPGESYSSIRRGTVMCDSIAVVKSAATDVFCWEATQ